MNGRIIKYYLWKCRKGTFAILKSSFGYNSENLDEVLVIHNQWKFMVEHENVVGKM